MSVFVDTSALPAVLDADDANHGIADRIWVALIQDREELITTSYVLVETFALVQARLGLEAVAVLHQHIVPLRHIDWVDSAVHGSAVRAVLMARRRAVSLVDCASSEVMRTRGLRRVFAFERHFTEQGFSALQ